MPDECHKEVPLHRALARSRDPEETLEKVAALVKVDIDSIRKTRRISKAMKDDRDLLVFILWQTCALTNEETGRLFGITYSAASRILDSMRTRVKEDNKLAKKMNHICSQFKM